MAPDAEQTSKMFCGLTNGDATATPSDNTNHASTQRVINVKLRSDCMGGFSEGGVQGDYILWSPWPWPLLVPAGAMVDTGTTIDILLCAPLASLNTRFKGMVVSF